MYSEHADLTLCDLFPTDNDQGRFVIESDSEAFVGRHEEVDQPEVSGDARGRPAETSLPRVLRGKTRQRQVS